LIPQIDNFESKGRNAIEGKRHYAFLFSCVIRSKKRRKEGIYRLDPWGSPDLLITHCDLL
jgi:hypothetical protein